MLLALWQSSGLFPGVQGDLGVPLAQPPPTAHKCPSCPQTTHKLAKGVRKFILEFADDCADSDGDNVMMHKSEEKREMPC